MKSGIDCSALLDPVHKWWLRAISNHISLAQLADR
jgi:hypothetical protein